MGTTRYRSHFYSTEDVYWQIEITDIGYSGSGTECYLAPPGFTLQYQNVKERFDPVIGSSCKLHLLITDAVVRGFLTDLAITDASNYFLKIWRNSAFFWGGMLIDDLIKMEDMPYPYQVDLSFSDNLGQLKEIEFSNAGTKYTGWEDMIGIITKCLTKTGITGLWGTNDQFLKTCVQWYDANHVFAVNLDPLKYSRVDHAAFHLTEGDGDEVVITAPRTYEVLTQILYTFGARIYLSRGMFHIFQINEYVNEALITRVYKKDGTFISGSYADNCITNSSDLDRLTGAIESFMPPLLEAKRKYVFKQSPLGSQSLPPQSLYETAVNCLNDFAGGNGEKLRFTGKVLTEFVFSGQHVPFCVKFRMNIIITKADGTKNYLTNGDGIGPYIWSSNSAHYCTVWVNVFTEEVSFIEDILFTTATIPWNCTATFKFYKLGYYLPDHTTSKTPEELNITSFNYWCEEFFLQELYSLYYNAPNAGEVTFKCVNTFIGTFAGKVCFEIPDAVIGDGPNIGSLGRIQAYGGGAWVNSTEWRIKNDITNEWNIGQLLVNQIILGQQLPVDKWEGDFVSSVFTADKCIKLAMGTTPETYTYWLMLGGSFSASTDQWKLYLFRLKFMRVTGQVGLWLDEDTELPLAEWNNQEWENEDIDTTERTAPAIMPDTIECTIPLSQTMTREVNLMELLYITRLDEYITSGDVKTELDVTEIADALLLDNDVLFIVRPTDFYATQITLSADQAAGAVTLSIDSKTFTEDYPAGSWIIFKAYNLLALVR